MVYKNPFPRAKNLNIRPFVAVYLRTAEDGLGVYCRKEFGLFLRLEQYRNYFKCLRWKSLQGFQVVCLERLLDFDKNSKYVNCKERRKINFNQS